MRFETKEKKIIPHQKKYFVGGVVVIYKNRLR